jgi:hypothetical protein
MKRLIKAGTIFFRCQSRWSSQHAYHFSTCLLDPSQRHLIGL